MRDSSLADVAAALTARVENDAKPPAPPYRFLPVRWQARIVIVPLASILRIDARGNYVTIVADRSYRHREALTTLCARLPEDAFVRVHRSHAVNIAAVRELRARAHGEYLLALRDGSTLISGRTYREAVQRAFGM